MPLRAESALDWKSIGLVIDAKGHIFPDPWNRTVTGVRKTLASRVFRTLADGRFGSKSAEMPSIDFVCSWGYNGHDLPHFKAVIFDGS